MASGNKVKKVQNTVSVKGLCATDNEQHNAATAVNKRRIKISFCFLGRLRSSVTKSEQLTAI